MSQKQASAVAKSESSTAETGIDTSKWQTAETNIDGWYAPDVTGRLVGKVLESFVSVSEAYGEQDVVKVKTAIPVKVIQGKGEESKEVEIPKNSIVAVRISANLTSLLDLVTNQCLVEIVPNGKVKLDAKRTMWRYAVKFEGQRVAHARTKPTTSEGNRGAAGDDNIPF